MNSRTLTTTSWFSVLRLAIVLMLLCGGLYPLISTQLGQALFPEQAHGSLVYLHGEAVGSRLAAQSFSEPRYFHSRPSAADYDPTGVSGSNLAPSNPELRQRVARDAAALSHQENVPVEKLPVDLVTASGSGIDPHISPAAAELQAPRVAAARGLPMDQVRRIIAENTQAPFLGVFGPTYVNVLTLNVALDQAERINP
ncbi:Potassium-transporting ATPase C chain [Alloalcanivorax dieselolei B5]|uniref:Potassium-transporting ATPase KdpC subunit n=1 Tax=Alcanivorax dieselolei (strain DSM 16502 / CGMCC 1.3690 / MCCC 1A00001 / B-5) TaxID=930169 RepID=K0CB78_ALCDB|nr:potassium-transporting ATPase subunit KdpC [Alloalcanivorax dieselolei]AFT70769.1 Potassium-transporting ATPase C chain [Alloalcanivorax dieselolei B5]GGJ97612.1 potassium-transporting ATPase KdpC subunit [Alloalcanivorax dieselolei]